MQKTCGRIIKPTGKIRAVEETLKIIDVKVEIHKLTFEIQYFVY